MSSRPHEAAHRHSSLGRSDLSVLDTCKSRRWVQQTILSMHHPSLTIQIGIADPLVNVLSPRWRDLAVPIIRCVEGSKPHIAHAVDNPLSKAKPAQDCQETKGAGWL